VGFALVLACVFSQNVNSQIISWDFTSGNTPNTNLPSGTTALSFNTGGTIGTFGCPGTGYSSTGWNVGEYLQIVIPLSGYELTTLTFNARSSNTGPWKFKFQYSSTGTGGTFTDLGTTVQITNSTTCGSYIADFSAINALDNNANTVIRLVFTGGEADGSPATGDAGGAGTFRIDDLIINGTALPCSGTPSPGNTVASLASVTSGSSTALSLQNVTSGSGVTYQWYSSTTSASGPWTAIGTSVSTLTATPAAISTWYYCAVTCSGSTGNSTPVQVTATYCTPTGSTSYYLTNITTTGGITNINNTTTNSAGGYGNYSASLSTSNYPGYTTNISMTPSSGTNYYYCWIDWNNDLDFLDGGEIIFATTTFTASYSGSIVVPTGQAAGTYRMRVANSWSGTIAAACGPASNGEFEDYSFIVVAQTPCSSPTAPGNTIASAISVPSGTTVNLSLQNATTGSGVTYQWYSSTTSATGPWTTIGSATNATYSTAVSVQTWFYCVVTCAGNGGTSSIPVGVTVTLTPNVDCSSAIQLCSDSQVNGASSGPGIADLTISTSGCLGYSSESQSNWFYSQVSTTGVFSFSITPTNGTDDYDFAVWRFSGTPVTCPPQAQPDRCSFAAVGGNTGLGNNATDVSEGTSGDRWVSTLNVNAGDYLLILVNNYSATYSPFTMDFTGSSGLNCNPINLQCNISGTTNTCIGSSEQLTGSGSPAASTPWTSSSPSVATVTNTGVVSGLSAGTTTITYVNSNGCSTSVLFTVNSTTINVSNITTTICSGNLFSVSPTDGTNGSVPAGTTYTWSTPSGSNFTGGAAESGASTINGTLTLSSGSSTTAVYTVTPSLGSCLGNTFTVTVNLSDCTTAAPFTACNLVVYTVGDGTTSLSGNSNALPVRLLEISQSGTLVQSITSLFTDNNLLTAPGSAVSQGFLNSYNGFTAVAGLNLNVNTTNSNTNNNKVTELINGGVPNLVTRIVHPTTGTMPFTGDNYRSVIPTSSTTFYAAGDASNSTDGVWYFNGSSFNQLVGLTARNVEIFNNQLYVSQSSKINEVGIGTPTSGTQSLNPILTYASASIYDFSISPDGCTMYVADNGSSSYRGVTKWTKSTINGTWTAGINYPCYGYGLAADYSGSSHVIYLTMSLTNATAAPNKIICLTDNGSFTLNWTYTAASNYRLAGIDFTPNSTSAIANPITTQPIASTSLCNTQTQTLSITTSGSPMYQWYSNTVNSTCGATPISGATSATYTPPATGVNGVVYYFVKVSVNCSQIFFSNISTITTVINPTPTATNNGPICVGGPLTIATPSVLGASYSWTGPNSFTSNTQNPTVTMNATSVHEGIYSVTTTVNGCTGLAGTTLVTIYSNPSLIFLSPP